MTKKLLCLNVELLKAFERIKPIYSFGIPSPTLCTVFVTASMNDLINEGLKLIEENELIEVVFYASDVNWFSALDKRIYQTINSSIHITKDSIYYTGAFAPEIVPVGE